MDELKLGVVEAQFADIIWLNEPLASRELVRLCEEKLKWKKSTTYTVLKKLCDRGIFKNVDGTVSSVISKAEYFSAQSEKIVNDSFGGSLPAFIAAFTSRKTLTDEEIAQIRSMIESAKEE
ncbi:MAG: BlaI/MecI/CopY family transcriptional regulator [Clostridia bacterium]|nr:BlaI/MecI/CopY family transcriptional regulator [Clostridia bacterium]